MKIKNEAMLITYADSLGKNMGELKQVLDKHLQGVIGGVHLLPFFPSTGDRGFAPSDYTTVDPALGTWEDVEELGEDYYLMFDFMINHISRESKFFQDFKKNHEQSPYKEMFIRIHEFFPENRPTQEDIDLIYKRKDKAPFQTVEFADGTTEEVWNTFGEEQIDLDVTKEVVKEFIRETIKDMANHGCSLIRLDAFAYAIKKLDTNDFFVEPDIWELLDEVRQEAAKYDVELLPEIHEHYSIQMKIANHDYYIYDFALPMVTLYSLYSGKSERLANWLKMSPMKQFTTLDTHDGIGVVDARDLLTDEELDYTSEELYKVGANVKKVYSSANYNNLDIYQINSTYYSALGDNDRSYLLARAIQVFAPGIPQIYYVGLLAGKNDIELLEATKEGRNINRHYYDLAEIEEEVQRPVIQQLFALLKFRNESAAFDLDGTIEVATPSESEIVITRKNKNGSDSATLTANLDTKEFIIESKDIKIFTSVALKF
ncbi:sucrose phosphorylase [Enterococcus faecalis]|uniref:Sucrose phosphorylase n=3 Tax=Enterococcus faecalis TaxID=1351 RepID=A0A3N3G6A7_ENTFL|nr:MULTISPECIES: sucrose phosphorylase [Bacilli]EFM69419.1 sucrose phosphorylase [Enterococcus faecalis TX0109]EGO2646212.1 sucrose phosphorylase [Enterococcus faecalis]EGO2801235.1 sucrose phosphorylase [Enterococcus faecalis]EGO5030422.1 sucrose phosphorylase [Enterococcus faecalis]EGO5140729.1 sucrose phosphorylase [Enterococcus faecalis]